MKRQVVAMVIAVMAVAASLAFASTYQTKLPKCSGKLCHGVGCSAEVLCASGASVKTCAEVCGGK